MCANFVNKTFDLSSDGSGLLTEFAFFAEDGLHVQNVRMRLRGTFEIMCLDNLPEDQLAKAAARAREKIATCGHDVGMLLGAMGTSAQNLASNPSLATLGYTTVFAAGDDELTALGISLVLNGIKLTSATFVDAGEDSGTPIAQNAQSGSWTCAYCGSACTDGAFCPHCGGARE